MKPESDLETKRSWSQWPRGFADFLREHPGWWIVPTALLCALWALLFWFLPDMHSEFVYGLY